MSKNEREEKLRSLRSKRTPLALEEESRERRVASQQLLLERARLELLEAQVRLRLLDNEIERLSPLAPVEKDLLALFNTEEGGKGLPPGMEERGTLIHRLWVWGLITWDREALRYRTTASGRERLLEEGPPPYGYPLPEEGEDPDD